MTPLPQPAPIPTRANETWRVEPERNMVMAEPDGICTVRAKGARWESGCHEEAVAMTRRGTLLLCERHLRESKMWIEGGRVASWALRR